MKFKSKRGVKKQVDKNTHIERKVSGVSKIESEGQFADNPVKHFNGNSVGVSIGATINMGDYESLRCDTWATVEVEENETIEEAIDRVVGILDKKFDKIVDSYTSD